MADTGWLLVGSGISAGAGAAWSNPGNITAEDGSEAIHDSAGGALSAELRARNPNPALPSSATVTGVEVRVKARYVASRGSASIVEIGLRQSNTLLGTVKLPATSLTESLATYDYGSAADLWSAALDPDIVNHSLFTAYIKTETSGAGTTANVDAVWIRIHYLPIPPADVGASANLPLGLATSTTSQRLVVTSEGPNDPSGAVSDASDGGSNWLSPGNVTEAGGSSSSVLLTNGAISAYLKPTGFGLAVPEDALITGILAEIDRYGFETADHVVRLVKGGVLVGENKARPEKWPDSSAYVAYGGEADLWDEQWTPEDVNDPDFGMVLSAITEASSAPFSRVHHMRITIYYTESAPEHVGASAELPLGLATTTAFDNTKHVGASAELPLGLANSTAYEGVRTVDAAAELPLGLATGTEVEEIAPEQVSADAELPLSLATTTQRTGAREVGASAELPLGLATSTHRATQGILPKAHRAQPAPDFQVWLYDAHTLEPQAIWHAFEGLEYRRRTVDSGTWSLSIHERLIDNAHAFTEPVIEIRRDGVADFWGILKQARYDRIHRRWTFSGQDLKWFLGGRVIIPMPANDPDATHDEQIGVPAESAILHYIRNHMGSGAALERQFVRELSGVAFTLPPDQARGKTITESARYASLINTISKLAKEGDLWFEMQRGQGLSPEYRLVIGEVADRTATSANPVVFSAAMGQIEDETYVRNRVGQRNVLYVLGQGEGVERSVALVDDIAHGEFRREGSYDQRNLSLESSLEASGQDKLAADRAAQETATIRLSGAAAAQYRQGWDLGMVITYALPDKGVELELEIVEVAVKLQSDGGEQIDIAVGDRPMTIQRRVAELSHKSQQATAE